MKRITSLLVLVVLVAFANDANAWVAYVCSLNNAKIKWPSNSMPLRMGKKSFPAGPYRDALNRAITAWNGVPVTFAFTKTFGDTSVGLGNGQNEVFISDDDPDWNPAIAITEYAGIWDCGNPRIDEVDVIFHPAEDYTTSMAISNLWNYAASGSRPLTTTALHELGHALGLGHENDEYNIMGEDWTHLHVKDGSAVAYAGEDATDAAMWLYTDSDIIGNDFSVAHYEWQAEDGEYSDHGFTEMNDNNGNKLVSVTDEGGRKWKVKRGVPVQLELTYENNGFNTHFVDIGFYVSTNRTISTGDTRIGGFEWKLARGDVATLTRTITVPNSFAPGDYWIGCIVDEDDDWSEFNESNNTTWVPIQLTLP